MQFGTSIVGLAQQPAGRDMAATIDDIVTWVREAEALGLDYLVAGQHYLTEPFEALQPLPLLARLASEVDRLRFVATLVAPLHNPVELAESWATLDVITGGRIGLSLALGYRPEEYAAFGVEQRRRVRVFVDVIETLRALWTEEMVTRHGDGFALERARCMIRPLQQPHPPLWIAANADAAVQRAARMGLPWNINAHAPFTTIERQVGLYRAAADGAARDAALPLARELFCAPTRAEAVALAAPYLGGKYQTYSAWGQDKVLPGDEDFTSAFEELSRDRFILGDPDDCAEEIERYRRLGVDRIHVRSVWPGMPLEQALEGLRLYATEVIPRLRAASGR